jgi:alpha-tubulin suppressor-like RCC1 family protein
VGTLTNWKQVTVNESTTTCIKTDGTLWAWGNNSLLPAAGRSSPIQVGTLTNWKQVSFKLATTFTDIV